MQETTTMDDQRSNSIGGCDWQDWYARWEQHHGQWLEPEHRPVTREDQIQTAWEYYTQCMRDELVECIKPLAVHVDYVCRIGDLFTREQDECWHGTAVALVQSCNDVLARYGYSKATCERPAAVGVGLGSCCRCGKQHA